MADNNRNPAVDSWFDEKQHPLEDAMKLADVADVGAARLDLEAAVRAWCESR